MKEFSFYQSATGRFLNYTFSGPEDYVAMNTPAGCIAIEGAFDSRCHCVVDGVVMPWQPPQPEDTEHFVHSWDELTSRWVASPTVAKLELDAFAVIDAAAGACRLRFITDVPGQQAVYMMKLQEATALLANPAAHAPHIASEAAATGVTPIQTAHIIVARADLWNSLLSPAIEAARIGGKAAVSAARVAGDAAALAAALASAIANLSAIGPP